MGTNRVNYGNLETDRGVLLYQEAGSECAEYPVDAVYAWDQPDLHFHVPCGPPLFDPALFCFQETLGIWDGAEALGGESCPGEFCAAESGL